MASLSVVHTRPSRWPGADGIHHAYLVYDARNNFYLASNPVPLLLAK